MTEVITLVTPLDFEAFADGQLAEERRNAVRRRLSRDGGAHAYVEQAAQLTADLRALKFRLYQDPELNKAMHELLKRRRQAA